MPYIDTKDVISQSFKNLMEKKSFDKITISDISDEAKINRQTFYYHFHDKYELLNTIFSVSYTHLTLPTTERV